MAKERLDIALPAETTSAEETRRLGASLVAGYGEGAVLALEGDLGAGKTHFVKGLVDGLGGDGEGVSSPTFTIAQEYETEQGLLLHVDAYRVEDVQEFAEMGLLEAFDDARLIAVEWPGRMGPFLPDDAVRISIRHLGGDRRRISTSA